MGAKPMLAIVGILQNSAGTGPGVAIFGDGVRMIKPSGVGGNDAVSIVRI